jgi:hypothetical protein
MDERVLMDVEINELTRLPETVARHPPVDHLHQGTLLDRLGDGELWIKLDRLAGMCDRDQLVESAGINGDVITEHGQPPLRRPHASCQGEQQTRPPAPRGPRDHEHRAGHEPEVNVAERPPAVSINAKSSGVHGRHIRLDSGRISQAAPQSNAPQVPMHARLTLCHEKSPSAVVLRNICIRRVLK